MGLFNLLNLFTMLMMNTPPPPPRASSRTTTNANASNVTNLQDADFSIAEGSDPNNPDPDHPFAAAAASLGIPPPDWPRHPIRLGSLGHLRSSLLRLLRRPTIIPSTTPVATAIPAPAASSFPPPSLFAGTSARIPTSPGNPFNDHVTPPCLPTTSPLPASNAAASHHAGPVIRLGDLPVFTGTEPSPGLALDRWFQQLEAFFLQFPEHTDVQRISTATMRLNGPALDWVRVNCTQPTCPGAWVCFVETLMWTFAPLDRSLTARADLAACRQTSSVAEYLMRFNLATAPITDLHASEKFQRFVEGLKHNVRREVLMHPVDVHDFPSAAAYATRWDSLSIATSTTASPSPAQVHRPIPAPYRPPPARLNAVTSATPAVGAGPRPPITPEERATIAAAGGCTYCRNVLPPLHTVENCPKKRSPPSWVVGNGRSQ